MFYLILKKVDSRKKRNDAIKRMEEAARDHGQIDQLDLDLDPEDGLDEELDAREDQAFDRLQEANELYPPEDPWEFGIDILQPMRFAFGSVQP